MSNYTVKALRQNYTSRGVYWNCNLYLDGKKVAEVENRGDGGANWYHWEDGCKDLENELLKLAAVAVPEYDGDLDIFFETLIAAYEDAKEARKLARKNAA
jgi:hypothetical protein